MINKISGGSLHNLIDSFIDFNPTSSVDAKFDIFDRSNTTVYAAAARLGYYDAASVWTFHISELTVTNLALWFNTGYERRIYPVYSDDGLSIDGILAFTATETNTIYYTWQYKGVPNKYNNPFTEYYAPDDDGIRFADAKIYQDRGSAFFYDGAIDLREPDAEPTLYPISVFDGTGVLTFDDLTGITIVSNSGDDILSISGNTIIDSGVGDVWDLVLSDGTVIPCPHLGIGWNGSTKVTFTVSGGVTGSTDANGSTYLYDNGYVEKPNLVVNGDFSDGTTGWTVGSSWELVDGAMENTGSSYGSYLQRTDAILSQGVTYAITYEIVNNGVQISMSNGETVGNATDPQGMVYYYFTPNSGCYLRAQSLAGGAIDNITVTELTEPKSPAFDLANPLEVGDVEHWGVDDPKTSVPIMLGDPKAFKYGDISRSIADILFCNTTTAGAYENLVLYSEVLTNDSDSKLHKSLDYVEGDERLLTSDSSPVVASDGDRIYVRKEEK